MALEHLGLAYLMVGRDADAEHVLRRATAIAGAPPSVAMRLGIALMNQGKHEEAIRHLRQALSRDPQNVDCRLNLGQTLARSGDISAARETFEDVLKDRPGQPEALFNLGVLALQAEDLDHARILFERVIEHKPDSADAMANLGLVLQKQGLLNEARRQFEAALAMAADHLGALEGIAFVSLALSRTGEAVKHLRRLLECHAHHRGGLAALAEALFELGQLEEAAATAKTLCENHIDDPAGYATLANVHIVKGELDRAIAILKSGYARTGNSHLLGMLAYQLRHTCAWDEWADMWEAMQRELSCSSMLGSPFWLLCEPVSAINLLRYTQRWANARFRAVAAAPHVARSPAQRRDRIRIGYLSSDFQEHAVAYLIAEVLELHDRERFEIFAYSHGPDDRGAMRPRLQAACEHFIDIAREPDDVAAARIRSDELDVLVDLKGYTAGDRLTIMARRPCQVQVTWLGYPGTTGAEFIDYLIADPFIIPPGQESAYSESILRMPHCYQPNDRRRPISATLDRSEYGIPDDTFVFCCLNQTYKITREVFELWMRLLEQRPNSVLWLMDSNAWAKAALLAHAERHGMADRVVFAPKKPNAEHLARYRAADLALDTFPYTSHTTLSDALWLGCPAVALCGQTFASRVSGSLLTSSGLSDLVTYGFADYERLAHRLASDGAALDRVRERIAQARDQSPLFDSIAFTRALEGLYLDLVGQHKT
jgi:predicted O-linked N-acetylglucosamine transferase (SPINDLY family)